uniref:Uncharacterized protein n=1 Tax=Gossypium raimondii TaxID=29730 RepID=A0A0D2W133_GOSRA|nr:hypothetical protein B456_013G1558002 [Gossypium raimondii]
MPIAIFSSSTPILKRPNLESNFFLLCLHEAAKRSAKAAVSSTLPSKLFGKKEDELTQLWQMKTVKCRMNMRVKGLLRKLPLWSQFQIRILLMKSYHSDRRK